MKKKILWKAVAAITAAVSLMGCTHKVTDNTKASSGESTAAATDTASNTGKDLVIYTWENMFPQEVLDGFTKETGIKVVYSNFDSDETMLEKLSQAKGGTYDLVFADDYIIEQAVKSGLTQE